MKSSVDILAVGAHPDDVEIGCGGALLLAAATGLRTAIVDLTAGERSTRGDPRKRRAECDAATSMLDVAHRESLRLPDAELDDSQPSREALIGVLRRLRPQVVLAPLPDDRHPDHAATGRLVRAVCFLGGVGAVGSGASHRPSAVYHYFLHHTVEPSLVLDITAVWDAKWQAINAYTSQFHDVDVNDPPTHLSAGSFLRAIEARSVVFGAMIGVSRGEPFWCAGPVGFQQLPWIPFETGAYRAFL